jgi:hypothetical protein
MDQIPYQPTDKATVLSLRVQVEELERVLRHLDRHSLDLWLYVQSLERAPDADEWDIVTSMIREVRDAYGLRTPDR